MKMREQRLMGLVMVILSGWLLAWAFAGQTPEEDEPLSRRSRPAAQEPDIYRQAGASPAKYTTQSKMKGAV